VTLTAPPRLLLVHAHPDDESLWTGGTIARHTALGGRVTVVTCTLGEQGEVIPPELAGLAADVADQLGGYRIGELRAACAVLGVEDQRFLGGVGRWRDSGMAGTPANRHPRAFIGGDLDEQAGQLRSILREVAPDVVITYAADGGYGHPDHIRAHEVTMRACDDARPAGVLHVVTSRRATANGLAVLAELDDLPWRVPDLSELRWVEDDTIDVAVDVRAVESVKLAAVAAHTTQVQVFRASEGTACYALSNGLAAPVPPAEYYVLARGEFADDLFGGGQG
jgi:N-acetyl-1-D-myo-inositol-2-amino-2-deoxy-alpha-D-glucopyranoside deacetylase